MPNFFCFREKYYRYFGCIPIQVALGLAVFIAFGTQYYAVIIFLTEHVWYWFIALGAVILADTLLFWAIYSKKSVLFYPLMLYQACFVLLLVGCVVWMIVDLFSPYNSKTYSNCNKSDFSDACVHKATTLAGINLGVFLISVPLNIFVLDIFFRFRIYLKTESRQVAVNVVDRPISETTVNRPTYGDPTSNIIYSPGNTFQPQPLYAPQSPQLFSSSNPPPQQAYNPSHPPYPTVRGPTAPVYASSTPLEQLHDPPPAYSQAVSQGKY